MWTFMASFQSLLTVNDGSTTMGDGMIADEKDSSDVFRFLLAEVGIKFLTPKSGRKRK
jgi:hypothetical protein